MFGCFVGVGVFIVGGFRGVWRVGGRVRLFVFRVARSWGGSYIFIE